MDINRRRRTTPVRDERGQGLIEYALIMALVSLASISALGFLSGRIDSLFMNVGNTLNAVEASGGAGNGGSGGVGGTGGAAPVTDLEAPTVTIAAPADGASNVGFNPTYSGSCGTAPGDLPNVTLTIERVAGNPDSGSPYGPFTTPCNAGTWSLTHPGSGASEGLKNNRTYRATVAQADSAGNVADASTTFTV